jgi:hypothetical protein
MSINVTIRTGNRTLDFEQVLGILAGEGYKLVVKNICEEICEFYQHKLSTRPIDISLEENGYEVRITTFACREDYELFVKTIGHVKRLTGGNVFYEDDDDEPVSDVDEYFNALWIEEQMSNDFSTMEVLITSRVDSASEPDENHEIGLFGPVCMFYLGQNLFDELCITPDMDWKEGSNKLIERFRYSQYSRPRDIRRTTTSLVIKLNDTTDEDEDEDEENRDRLTVYSQNDYDMISRTTYIALKGDDMEMLILKYEDFMKVVPEQWERFDNCQYFTTPLTDKQFKQLWDRSREYSIDSPAAELPYDEKLDKDSGMEMLKALAFADVDYMRQKTDKDNLPPCAKSDTCDAGYNMPPIFYAIAKCQETIFSMDSYAAEYMPVVLEMKKRAKAIVDFWENEAGFRQLNLIPYNLLSTFFDVPGDDATVKDVMGYEPQDFRDAGFSNSDIILYIAASKFDFYRVSDILKNGTDPEKKIYPASEKEKVFCISDDMFEEGYSAFQYIYAKYKWYLDKGEMVMNIRDVREIISCAAHLQMYDFLQDGHKKFLEKKANGDC